MIAITAIDILMAKGHIMQGAEKSGHENKINKDQGRVIFNINLM